MVEQIENLKRLLAKLRELNNLDKLTERVDKTMKGLHDQKTNLLRQIEEKFVHYNNFRNLRQEESEERKLLQALERVVLREKRYIRFLMNILKKFSEDTKKMGQSLSGHYPVPQITAGAFIGSHDDPEIKFGAAIRNLFYYLSDMLSFTDRRTGQELSFIKKWAGGTGPLSFFRQKSVLNNFKKELEGLYALYKENEEYVKSQLQKIPALQMDIQIKTTNYITDIRKTRVKEINYAKAPKEGYERVVFSLGKESSHFGRNLAYGILAVGAGVAIGQAIKRF